MTGGKKITSYSLSPEAQGKAEYVDTSIACYMMYPCSYCNEEFYLVNPYTQTSGGAIQRELAKHKNTGEVLAVLQPLGFVWIAFMISYKDSKQQEVSSYSNYSLCTLDNYFTFHFKI